MTDFKWVGDPPRPYAKEPPDPSRPRCEATVSPGQLSPHLRKWRRERYGEKDWDKCTRKAHVEIGGRKYCMLHGGQVAISLLAEAASRAPQPDRVWVVGDPQSMGDYEVVGVFSTAEAAEAERDQWDLTIIGEFELDKGEET